MNNVYLSVVIPTFNEEERLPRCLEKLEVWLKLNQISHEIIVVDNGSTDHTLKVLSDYQRFNKHLFFEVLGVRGKGRAISHGMLVASGDYRYMCDVDLSTPLDAIVDFLEQARKHDVVIGSRALDPALVTTTLKRKTIGRVFHWLARDLISGVADSQCGFKMFRAQAARDIFERTKVNGMAFDVEAIWLARRLGYDVFELPVEWHNDDDSRVRLVGDSLQMLKDVISIPLLHPELRRALSQV